MKVVAYNNNVVSNWKYLHTMYDYLLAYIQDTFAKFEN